MPISIGSAVTGVTLRLVRGWLRTHGGGERLGRRPQVVLDTVGDGVALVQDAGFPTWAELVGLATTLRQMQQGEEAKPFNARALPAS